MMGYLTNNPWPVVLVLAGVAIAAFLSGSAKGRGISVLAFVMAAGLLVLEHYLISPEEYLEQEVETMLTHFKTRDLEAISSQIDEGSPKLNEIAARGLELVDLSPSFHIKSVQVTLDSDSSATAMVRANGEVTLRKRSGATHRVPNFWKTVWIKHGETWKLSAVTRLNPVNGTEMGYFSGN